MYFLFFHEKKIKNTNGISINEPHMQEDEPELDKIYLDENGKKYKIVHKTRILPRKTYLYGRFKGKFWAELNELKDQEYKNEKFYDFTIYEIKVIDTEYQFIPFNLENVTPFPRERLPELILIQRKEDGKEYAVNILEPQIEIAPFNRKHQQVEGNEAFGTIEGKITGYLLDFIEENYSEPVYIQEREHIEYPITIPALSKTLLPTGNVEINDNYKRIEYFYSDFNTKYWSNWKYIKSPRSSIQTGCVSNLFGILSIILFIIFLIAALPNFGVLLPFILLPILIRFLPDVVWKWLFRILGGILVFAFLFAIINSINESTNNPLPKPVVNSSDTKPQYTPITDTLNNKKIYDTLIVHFRHWKDYDGNNYSGKFWVKKSDFANANSYKNNLDIIGNTEFSYDKIIYSLKENDKENLNGIYHLFDSLKLAGNLSPSKLAEVIVSFVQDIPYTVVLPNACDPALYSDDFIRNYLASANSRCDGYEKFGINTPVEFMATLFGDCDTRTLFIYTVLSHYGYDVVLLSSEFYNHSLIGINLPYEGITYTYHSQRYVLWETTAQNIRPGILPEEVSNLNYWRISLKSK